MQLQHHRAVFGLLAHYRLTATGANVQVVRCFEDENVIHVAGKVDPVDDIDVINFELAVSDITQIEKRLDRLKKGKKSKEEAAAAEARLLS